MLKCNALGLDVSVSLKSDPVQSETWNTWSSHWQSNNSANSPNNCIDC